eukprot:6426746-Prymnesium_polylepis.1
MTGARARSIVHLRPDMCVPLHGFSARPLAPAASHLGSAEPPINGLLTRAAHDAVLVLRGKGKAGSEQSRLACSDSFGIVPRQHAPVYFGTVEQYRRCANASVWRAHLGQHYAGYFERGVVLGEIALKKQLSEHRPSLAVPDSRALQAVAEHDLVVTLTRVRSTRVCEKCFGCGEPDCRYDTTY